MAMMKILMATKESFVSQVFRPDSWLCYCSFCLLFFHLTLFVRTAFCADILNVYSVKTLFLVGAFQKYQSAHSLAWFTRAAQPTDRLYYK